MCNEIKAVSASANSNSIWDTFTWGKQRKLQAFWNEVGGQSDPPACLQDCRYIEKVADSNTLGCFAKCAVALPCVSDCAAPIVDMLNSKRADCGKSPDDPVRLKFDQFDGNSDGQITAQELLPLVKNLGCSTCDKNGDSAILEDDMLQLVAAMDTDGSGTINYDEFIDWWRDQPTPTPAPATGELKHSFSSNRAATTVVVLPDCLSSCKGFEDVLNSRLNCAATKGWATLLTSTLTPGRDSTQSRSTRRVWGMFNSGQQRRRLQSTCTSNCSSDDLLGLRSLSQRTCDGSAHI